MANETSLIVQGAELMIYGMGTVFVFLGLLVFAVLALAAAVRHWLPPAATAQTAPPALPGAVDDRLRAIIQAAIDRHRTR